MQPDKNALARLAGMWHTTGRVFETKESSEKAIDGTDSYEWLPGNHFLLHRVDVKIAGEMLQSTEVIGYNHKAEHFMARSFDSEGQYSEFILAFSGDKITITGEKERFFGEFSPDGNTVSGHWEAFDGQKWKPSMEVTLKK